MESAGLKRFAAVFLGLALAVSACGGGESVLEGPKGEGGTGGGGGQDESFDLRIPGMDGAADVSFDSKGVLHASCVSDADCMRVLGYFHASHRFWQMDIQRRAARGRLASLIPIQLGLDVTNRAMFSTSEGVPLEEETWRLLSEEEQGLLESYSAGVNAWLGDLREGRNGARLSEEYSVALVVATPKSIPDWDPLDSLAFVRLMTFALSDSSNRELAYGQAFAKLAALSPEMALDLLTLRPAVKSYTVPASGGVHPLRMPHDTEALSALGERLARAEALFEQARLAFSDDFSFFAKDASFGSNNWVLAPSRTEGKKAILANDPHLALGNPSIFYLAHLDAKSQGEGTLHVAGATFPGIPAVAIGRNEKVAWGATVAFYDVMDLYVETLDETGDAVIFNGEKVPMIRKEVSFEIGGRGPQKAVLEWVPHHGPVISRDAEKGTALTLRWTGHEPTNEFRAFFELNRAGTVAEAKEALRSFEVGGQNFVLADVAGAIGWYPHARIPKRPWASFSRTSPLDPSVSLPPWMPLPGDGSAEWDGFLDEGEIPRLFDPPKGFISTANQDLTGATEDGDPTSSGQPMLQNLPAPGIRMARVVDRLEAGADGHTVESSLALQLDTHSLVGEMVVQSLLDAAEGEELSAEADSLLSVLAAWNFSCPTGLAGHTPKSPPSQVREQVAEANGCAAFHFTLARIMGIAFGGKIKAAGMTSWDSNILIRPLIIGLQRPEELADAAGFWNEVDGTVRTKEEVLVQALEKAGKDIVGPFGSDPKGWLWGKHHTVTMKTELSLLAGSLDLGPFAAPGGLFTVNVANPPITGSGYQFSNGASLRIVSELGGEGISTWLQLPGGRDLHRDGDHYGDLVEPWLEGRSFELPFSPDAVEASAASTLRVGP